MDKFYLDCWVPSLKDYYKISELKIKQLDVLSKYLINDNNLEINKIFNSIILDNLQNKDIFIKLNRFDKWFILSFLRAVNISDTLTYNASSNTGPCSVEISLLKILSDFSELKFTNNQLQLDNFIFNFKLSNELYLKNNLDNIIESVELNNVKKIFSSEENVEFIKGLTSEIKEGIEKYLYINDTRLNLFLLENKANLGNFRSVRFRIYDNTLFYFLKSIFLPYAQSIYRKKYLLINKIGLHYNELDDLTPAECDVFINQFMAEEKEKKSGKSNSLL